MGVNIVKKKGYKMDRFQKYINEQKRKGNKRISFYIDEKLWKYLKKLSKKENLTVPELIKKQFNFK